MKKFWSAVIIVFTLLPAGAAGATSLSVSQTIHLSGVVPEMRYIVVDSHDKVTEITSNTVHDITPRVYRGSLQSGIQVPLTPAILRDYRAKIAGRDMHSTELHFSPRIPETAVGGRTGLSVLLRDISFLRLPSLL